MTLKYLLYTWCNCAVDAWNIYRTLDVIVLLMLKYLPYTWCNCAVDAWNIYRTLDVIVLLMLEIFTVHLMYLCWWRSLYILYIYFVKQILTKRSTFQKDFCKMVSTIWLHV